MPGKTVPTLRTLLVVLLLAGAAVGLAADDSRNPFTEGTINLGQSSADSQTPGVAVLSLPGESAVVSPAATPAPAPKPAGRYVVVRGDCLWKIAQRFLGNGARYWDLVEANKDRYPSLLKNPNLIYPGWEFVIPGVNVPPSTSTPGTGTGSPSTVNPPSVGVPASGAKGGKALLGWLQQTGLTGEALRQAWAVGMKESSGNPRAFNGNANTGDKSYGLFQINMIGSMGPARLKQYGLKNNEELFDPVVNCRVMMKLSKNGTNWGPWGIGPHSYKKTQSSPQYEKFYNSYPPK